MDTLKKKLGDDAEAKACTYLQKQGLQCIERNYRGSKGEIDLIMRDRDDIVFVEVRSRAYNYFGSAVESVTAQKQQKIFKTAIFYLQQKKWLDKVNFRFDIVGICNGKLEWIKNAFTAGIT